MNIPYGRQEITQADIEAVVEVLRSDFLTQGPKVPEFEAAVAKYVGARQAVAVNSATSALHIACLALDVGPGSHVWTSPITFVASANCAIYCGAKVDFVDIDPETWNLCPKSLERKLIASEADGTLPKVVIPVHLAGQSCDMAEIHALSKRFGFRIIEDASHAIGGRYRDDFIGNCRYSDITVFSFHPVKIITTAEGGMAVTNDTELASRMELLRSHGITRDPAQMSHAPDGPWYYQQVTLGYNYRMTDLQAALGLSQISRLDAFIERRTALAARYDQLLGHLRLKLPAPPRDVQSAWHLYVIRVTDGRHRATFDTLRAAGVGVNLHYIPVHTQPYYTAMGFAQGQFPASEAYYDEAISIPLYAGLSDPDQDYVVRAIEEALA